MATCKKCGKSLGKRNRSGFCGKHWYCSGSSIVKRSHRDNNLKTKRGITIQEYELALAQQNGKCALCGEKLVDVGSVDHNHTSGKLRGVLCHNCNCGLGMFKDNIDILRKAYQYLVLHGC